MNAEELARAIADFIVDLAHHRPIRPKQNLVVRRVGDALAKRELAEVQHLN